MKLDFPWENLIADWLRDLRSAKCKLLSAPLKNILSSSTG